MKEDCWILEVEVIMVNEADFKPDLAKWEKSLSNDQFPSGDPS